MYLFSAGPLPLDPTSPLGGPSPVPLLPLEANLDMDTDDDCYFNPMPKLDKFDDTKTYNAVSFDDETLSYNPGMYFGTKYNLDSKATCTSGDAGYDMAPVRDENAASTSNPSYPTMSLTQKSPKPEPEPIPQRVIPKANPKHEKPPLPEKQKEINQKINDLMQRMTTKAGNTLIIDSVKNETPSEQSESEHTPINPLSDELKVDSGVDTGEIQVKKTIGSDQISSPLSKHSKLSSLKPSPTPLLPKMNDVGTTKPKSSIEKVAAWLQANSDSDTMDSCRGQMEIPFSTSRQKVEKEANEINNKRLPKAKSPSPKRKSPSPKRKPPSVSPKRKSPSPASPKKDKGKSDKSASSSQTGASPLRRAKSTRHRSPRKRFPVEGYERVDGPLSKRQAESAKLTLEENKKDKSDAESVISDLSLSRTKRIKQSRRAMGHDPGVKQKKITDFSTETTDVESTASEVCVPKPKKVKKRSEKEQGSKKKLVRNKLWDTSDTESVCSHLSESRKSSRHKAQKIKVGKNDKVELDKLSEKDEPSDGRHTLVEPKFQNKTIEADNATNTDVESEMSATLPSKAGKRKRGRQKKVQADNSDAESEISDIPVPQEAQRKRGRPKKVLSDSVATTDAESDTLAVSVTEKAKKKRGRPKKLPSKPVADVSDSESLGSAVSPVKTPKKRGRKKKTEEPITTPPSTSKNPRKRLKSEEHNENELDSGYEEPPPKKVKKIGSSKDVLLEKPLSNTMEVKPDVKAVTPKKPSKKATPVKTRKGKAKDEGHKMLEYTPTGEGKKLVKKRGAIIGRHGEGIVVDEPVHRKKRQTKLNFKPAIDDNKDSDFEEPIVLPKKNKSPTKASSRGKKKKATGKKILKGQQKLDVMVSKMSGKPDCDKRSDASSVSKLSVDFSQTSLSSEPLDRSHFNTQADFNKYMEERDLMLALKLQQDFDHEERFHLTAIRSKGSEGEYSFRKKASQVSYKESLGLDPEPSTSKGRTRSRRK